MFVGRHDELAALEALYEREGFQMVVLYGRRRVGKTTLLTEFQKGREGIFFVAQEANDALNLELFSRQVYAFFDMPQTLPPFTSWHDVFSFIASKSRDRRMLLILDEFSYAAEANRSLLSILQNVIDHEMKGTHLFLILCGSTLTFMEHDVMGAKSPLYGRRTAQIKVAPFDYFDASLMLDGYCEADRIRFYAVFGGLPHYLSLIDPGESFDENVDRLVFSKYGYLYEEPMMLLNQELREPALYNSLLKAIAGGASKMNEITTAIGEERTKVTRYLDRLGQLDVLSRRCPFGEKKEKSRKGIYRFDDNFYDFWYRYVFPHKALIERGEGKRVFAELVRADMNAFIGKKFEAVCFQYMTRLNGLGRLPFWFSEIGSWWGPDRGRKTQEELDLVAQSKDGKKIIYGECKFKGEKMTGADLEKLQYRARLIGRPDVAYYYLFSRSGFCADLLGRAAEDDRIVLVPLEGLFQIG